MPSTKIAKLATIAIVSNKPAAKPSVPATKADQAIADQARYLANLDAVSGYGGASKPCTKNPKLAKLLENLDLALAGKALQAIGPNGPSPRDIKQAGNALRLADKAGTFCPVAANFDAGCISRGASAGGGFYVRATDPNRVQLTKRGRDYASKA